MVERTYKVSDGHDVPQAIDLDIHEILNQIRDDPRMLLPHLEEMRTQFKGKIRHRPGKIDLMTKEGVAVVTETIEYIKKVKKCPIPLTWC